MQLWRGDVAKDYAVGNTIVNNAREMLQEYCLTQGIR